MDPPDGVDAAKDDGANEVAHIRAMNSSICQTKA